MILGALLVSINLHMVDSEHILTATSDMTCTVEDCKKTRAAKENGTPSRFCLERKCCNSLSKIKPNYTPRYMWHSWLP